MRNFHRDFEALNDAYLNTIHKKPCECQLTEAVSDDIADIHRKGSFKQLREALSKLADAHHKDHSSLTYEDVYNEMKLYAEEKLMPEPMVPVPDQSPMSASGMHNPSPMGIATETNHATLRAAQTDEENEADDRKKARQDAQNKIMKKDLEDEEAEVTKEGTDGKTDDLTQREKIKLAGAAAEDGEGPLADDEEEEEVEEEFTLEQQIEMLKASEGIVEEEMYDCLRDGLSYAECCKQYPRECAEDGRSGKSKVRTESEEEDEEEEDKKGLEEDIKSFMNKQMQPGGDKKAQLSTGDITMAQQMATAAGGPTGNLAQRAFGQDGPTKIRKAYGNLIGAVADKLTKATKELKKNNPA